MESTTFHVFHSKDYAFSKPKKSVNLLKNLPQMYFIRKIEYFALKLLLLEIFRRGKISQKILMKKKWEMQKNALKLNTIFIVLDGKFYKYFFIFLKFSFF